jgi:hypothetical protein
LFTVSKETEHKEEKIKQKTDSQKDRGETKTVISKGQEESTDQVSSKAERTSKIKTEECLPHNLSFNKCVSNEGRVHGSTIYRVMIQKN